VSGGLVTSKMGWQAGQRLGVWRTWRQGHRRDRAALGHCDQ